MKRYVASVLVILMCGISSSAQTVKNYFQIAAENNPGLQALYYEYEAALQRVPQANALPDPVFSFGYFVSSAETRVGPQLAKLSLTQMLPWFGTLKAQGDVAALMADAKFQLFVDARNKLYLNVASAYYPLFELKELVRIEQENINILESYKNISTHKFENGSGTMVDVLRAEMMIKEAQTNLIILRDKETPLLTAFNKLLNRPDYQMVQINDSLKTNILSANFLKDSLIAANPALKALELNIQTSIAAERAAQKQGLPKLGVGFDYVIVGKRTDVSMSENGRDIFMPMVSVSIPIFRGKYNALVKEAQLMQESYTYRRQEAENTLISDYEMAWFQVQQQLQLLALYEQQIQTSQQSLNLLFASYGNSGKEFEEVLRMRQQLLKYQKMSITALTQYHIAVEKVNYLTSKAY